MAASIVVKYYRNVITAGIQSYDLRVVVDSAVDMPKEIFILQHGVAAPGNPAQDQFVCLADPVDLEEVPVGAPDLANEMPYFRMSEVTLRFRDMPDLEDTKTLIDEDIQRLVNALNAAANVELTETKTYA